VPTEKVQANRIATFDFVGQKYPLMEITNFEIEGLFGDRNVPLPLEGNALVLVGPNGLGKSSVVNIFYYAISRQWSRLLNYSFDRLNFTINGENVTLHRDEISGLIEVQKLLGSGSSRVASCPLPRGSSP
jgi:predicted ATP-binding protein involved in virulence